MSSVAYLSSRPIHTRTAPFIICLLLLIRLLATPPQAFSKNKRLETVVGYTIHSALLVPYFSWQRSHAVHHQFTNHMELGETHVPEVGIPNEGSGKARETLMEILGEEVGLNMWASLQAFLHLTIGWPAYLLIGATGGPARGLTNHFLPDPLTEPDENFRNKELFPGKWKAKVLKSDIGIGVVVLSLLVWGICNGFDQVMALYGGPYLVINAWLVLYTWLQHTDVDVPHFTNDDHSYVRGALHTIDRPYDKLDPWGVIDFLHHKVSSRLLPFSSCIVMCLHLHIHSLASATVLSFSVF